MVEGTGGGRGCGGLLALLWCLAGLSLHVARCKARLMETADCARGPAQFWRRVDGTDDAGEVASGRGDEVEMRVKFAARGWIGEERAEGEHLNPRR